MKTVLSYIIIFFSLSLFQSFLTEFQTEARPGGGGSYRSSSRSSSKSGSSRGGSSSFGRSSGGSFHGGSGSGSAVDSFITFIFAFVFSCAGVIILGAGLQALSAGDESKALLLFGLVFSAAGAWMASISSAFLYILLTVIFMMPLILIFLGIRKVLWGREIIFTAKGKMRDEK
ncbi:MAG TPA: hypothetical protein PL048_04890 [Leptospiraceae bacterium]|nr:hypothetical protein [Leptospiraceae bacterium]HMZ58085.1 hypothetical protein [Leptospiraceae bacterium]HNF15523.1 hypothetical protein [Leptospiraceae bacterium]HNF24933.1 hypothetical protein [Leptospiraceae bacterium]HNI94752.1 hypothetical protein [Leptospiraceae bacterium]